MKKVVTRGGRSDIVTGMRHERRVITNGFVVQPRCWSGCGYATPPSGPQ